MSIKDGLAVLVNVQARELELKFIDSEIAEVEQERAVARSEIEAAEGEVDAIRIALEDVRSVAKRLDIDLKSAEEKVTKFNDQMLTVRTNQELWAIQEEIGHAERAVSVVETKILEQLEHALSCFAVQIRCRLVREQDKGVIHEGAGNRYALTLTTR